MAENTQRVAIVTGAASGIGKAVATTLAGGGYAVAVVDLPGGNGAEVAADLGGIFVPADLARRNDCRVAVTTVIDRYGRVDVLVNNAGFQHIDPIQDFPEETWDRMIAVMLTAPFLMTKYAWPHMMAQGWGRVVNISSVHGLRASPFKAAYISAKHGLMGLTKTTALEGGPHGITVNAICPAYVCTPLVEKQIADQARTRGIPKSEVVEKVMLATAAIKRMIEPEEIGDMVRFLCSDAARSITGVDLTMDLGWTAH